MTVPIANCDTCAAQSTRSIITTVLYFGLLLTVSWALCTEWALCEPCELWLLCEPYNTAASVPPVSLKGRAVSGMWSA